jgi:uncharacterized RDD family membrane protein YckC
LSANEAAPQPRVVYVGFWRRLLATIIDWLIVAVVTVPLLAAIYGRQYGVLASEGYAGFWDFMIQALLPVLGVILFWRYYGATPGKMAIGAKIADAGGGRPRTARLVVRFVAYLVSALPLFLGFLWIAFDRRKQGWHDKIAGTVVIDED